MSLTLDFIKVEIRQQSYEISLHADEERLADGLLVSEVEFILLHGELIEGYPDDPRGVSCLVLGFTPLGCRFTLFAERIVLNIYFSSRFIFRLCPNGKMPIHEIDKRGDRR